MQSKSAERRKTPRRQIMSGGRILANGQDVACLVRDISRDGACLEIIASVAIPEQFRLVVELEGLDAECVVVRRQEREIGVEFLDVNRRRADTMLQARPSLRAATDHSMPLVLIAEDDPVYADMAEFSLTGLGFSVVAELDGAKALQVAGERAFDIIVLDIEMPGADGLSIIRALRASGPNRTTPLVVMTGHDDPAMALNAYKAGVTAFLSKPVDWESFPGNIKRILESSQALAEENGLMDKVRDWADRSL